MLCYRRPAALPARDGHEQDPDRGTAQRPTRRAAGGSWRSRTSNSTIKQNEFITLVGPSGCGKSTLLKLIGALIRPSRGKLLFDGTPVTASDQRRRHRVPGGGAAGVAQRARQRLAAGGDPRARQGEVARARDAPARARRPQGLRDALPARIVRRHAAAGVDMPCAHPRPSVLLMDEPFARARRDDA